jgi:hypothetical protein
MNNSLIIIIVMIWVVCVAIIFRYRNTPCQNRFLGKVIYGQDCAVFEPKYTQEIVGSLLEVDIAHANIFTAVGDTNWLVLYEMAQSKNEIMLTPEEVLDDIASVCLYHAPTDGQCSEGFVIDGACCVPKDERCFTQDGTSDPNCSTDKVGQLILPLMGAAGREYGMSQILDKLVDAFIKTKEEKIVSKLIQKGWAQKAIQFRTQNKLRKLVDDQANRIYKEVADLPDPGNAFKRKMREFVSELDFEKLFGDYDFTKAKLRKNGSYFADRNVGQAERDLLEKMVKEKKEKLLTNKNFDNLLSKSKTVQRLLQNALPSKAYNRATKYTSDMLRRMAGKTAKRFAPKGMSKALSRIAVKIAAKTSAKMTAMTAKLMMYVALGPVGVALMIFEVVSLALDLWDPLGFNNFTTMDVLRQQRDKIEISFRVKSKNEGQLNMTLHKVGHALDTDGPMLFPVLTVFQLQVARANKMYSIKVIDLIQADPVLSKEYDLLFQQLVEETYLLDTAFLSSDGLKWNYQGCPNPLPQYGLYATGEQLISLNNKFNQSVANTCVSREDERCLTTEDKSKWIRLEGPNSWIESEWWATKNGRGCPAAEVDCFCGVLEEDEFGDLIEDFDESIVDEIIVENADILIATISERIVSLSNRLPPRTRSKLLYDCLITQLAKHTGVDGDNQPFEFPEYRHHVSFCPELLPEDGPENASFTDIFRAISLTELAQKSAFDEIVTKDGDQNDPSDEFKRKYPYFPVWSNGYRVRDPTDPGTTVYPRAIQKTIPKLLVKEYVLSEDREALRLKYPDVIFFNPVLQEGETVTSDMYVAEYMRDHFAQLCALAPLVDSCLSKLDKSTGDLFGGIHKGGHHCKAYKSSREFEETDEQRLIPDNDPGKCSEKADILNNGTDEGEVPVYTTRWEARGDYSQFLNTRTNINPTDYGVTFDYDKGLCNFTKDYCMRFGLQLVKDEKEDIYDCDTFPGQEFLEMIFGTTVTRSGIIAAMYVDRQYVWVNDKLQTVCNSGLKAMGSKNEDFANIYKVSSCVGAFSMTAMRAFVQVGIASLGMLTEPISEAFTEFADLAVEQAGCMYKVIDNYVKNEGFDVGKAVNCYNGNKILFSSIAAGLHGFKHARAHAEGSFADAIGDMAGVFGANSEDVEQITMDIIDFATKYSGFDLAVDVSIKTAEWLAERDTGFKDGTLSLPISLLVGIRVGKNTNVCFGGNYCMDDIVNDLGISGIIKGLEKANPLKLF